MDRDARRRSRLRELGAHGSSEEELVRFNEPRHEILELIAPQMLSFPDEAHVGAWTEYARRATEIGGWESLRERFVQLHFPIREGMGQQEDYLNATQMGVLPNGLDGPALTLRDPDQLKIFLHPSLGGVIPVLQTCDRADFVTLVRAFAYRHEPEPVPDSMGACLVAGLSNWDRIRTYRREWEQAQPASRAQQEWAEEFHRLVPRKELYQDRFLILSGGPYSNVDAEAVGMDSESWLDLSLRIRLEHECAHYFTLRAFGSLGHNVLEELLADYAGLIRGYGSYDPSLALLFLGLESYPFVRSKGRLNNYLGTLSLLSIEIEQRLSHDAVLNLASLYRTHRSCSADPHILARILCLATSMSLEEAAAPDFLDGLSMSLRSS